MSEGEREKKLYHPDDIPVLCADPQVICNLCDLVIFIVFATTS